MSILCLVGEGWEEPSIVDLLLDINKVPTKPTYIIADDKPLILSDCVYEGINSVDTLQGLDSTSAHYMKSVNPKQ